MVHFLAAEQESLAMQFASPLPDMFAGVCYRMTASGCARIEGVLASVECVAHQVIPGGDHLIVIGRVVEAQIGGEEAHVINDPITGQGANTASKMAWMLGAAIRDGASFDEAFCKRIEQTAWAYSGPIAAWSNAMLQAPQPHMIELLVAASQHQSIADTFAGFFEQHAIWKNARQAKALPNLNLKCAREPARLTPAHVVLHRFARDICSLCFGAAPANLELGLLLSGCGIDQLWRYAAALQQVYYRR